MAAEEGAMAESNSEDQKPGEDRISNLPDDLLLYILSFVQSKTSVQTSILSSRWRHFWKRLYVLKLSDDSFEFNDNFTPSNSKLFQDYLTLVNFSKDSFEFNDNFIQFNSRFKEEISRLHLSIDSFEFANFIKFYSERFKHFRRFFYFVNSLIYVLRPYNVEKMRLSCTKSLTKNKMCTASIDAWIHSAMGPLLKELDITLYNLDNYCFELSENLSKCFNLVSLSLKGSLRLDRQPPKSFCLPSLKKLELDICAINVPSFNGFLHGCPCLETLDLCWYDEDYETFYVPPLCLPSSLKTLKIVLKYLSHLGFTRLPKLLGGEVTHTHFYCSTFDNLLYLNLNLLWFNSDSIMSLLQECRSLEVLIIQNDSEVFNDKEEQSSSPKWAAQLSLPSCLESHLKFIQFKGYRGFTDEFYFVEYILQNGCVLKSMIIVDISTDLKKMVDTLHRLFDIPKASRMCQLTYI
ncbi:unnamed protein product [Lathyrus sativus]|nr:unnamed protein product [Lathyrus sativus]